MPSDSITLRPFSLTIDFQFRHYILYISNIFWNFSFFARLKTCPSWGLNHTCRQPLAWEPTSLSTVPLSLDIGYHNRHYILYFRNIFGNFWTLVWKFRQVLWVQTPVEALVAIIAKVFLPGWKLAHSGDWTTPVGYPWLGNRPPYPLRHCSLAMRIIFAIIFCIFETFLEIIEPRFWNPERFWWVRIPVEAMSSHSLGPDSLGTGPTHSLHVIYLSI